MPAHTTHSIQCQSPAGPHTMVVQEWGDPKAQRVVVCVHGLTRISDDFKPLAMQLVSQGYRVIAPDVVGRGRSGWLDDPSHYHVGQYALDMEQMAKQLQLKAIDWVGTSMGGMIATILLGHPDRATLFPHIQVNRLVLNDVGPFVPGRSLDRIAQYLGSDVRLPDFEAVIGLVKRMFAGFGQHAESQWDYLARVVVVRESDGLYRFHYDPKIAVPFKAGIEANGGKAPDLDLWTLYDAIAAETLLIRGEDSDLLPLEVAQAMTERGPKARLVNLSEVGHAPSLLKADQIDLISNFLV